MKRYYKALFYGYESVIERKPISQWPVRPAGSFQTNSPMSMQKSKSNGEFTIGTDVVVQVNQDKKSEFVICSHVCM